MAQSGSGKNEKEALDAHKTALDEKKKSASRKMADEKKKQSSKYLSYFQESNSLLYDIHAAQLEIVENQTGMAKSLSTIASGITSISKMLKKGFAGVPISRATAKEMKDTSLFDDSDLNKEVMDGFVSMSENMSDTMEDFYTGTKPKSDVDNKWVDNLGNKVETIVDKVIKVADDIDDFESDELKMVDNAPQVMSETQADRMRDIEDMHKDKLYANVASIESNVAAIAKHYNTLKTKKQGKTGNPTEEAYEKKDKGMSFTEMLGSWFLLKPLREMFSKYIIVPFKNTIKKWFKSIGKVISKGFSFMWDIARTWIKTSFMVVKDKFLKIIGKFFGKTIIGVAMQFQTLFSSVSGFIGKFMSTKLAGALSVVIKPLIGFVKGLGGFFMTPLFMVYEAIKSFFSAGDTLGIADQSVTFLDRIQAACFGAISGFISGITFGLADVLAAVFDFDISAKGIAKVGQQIGDLTWKYITEPVLGIFEKIGESISKVIDDFISLLPKSWKEAGKSFMNIFGDDEENKNKETPAYEKSQAYLNKRKMQYTAPIESVPVKQIARTFENGPQLKSSAINKPVDLFSNKSNATPIAQSLNTSTAKKTDKMAAEARKKTEAPKSGGNVVVNNNSSGGGKQPSISRSTSSGRSDISRAIGRGSQFNFQG